MSSGPKTGYSDHSGAPAPLSPTELVVSFVLFLCTNSYRLLVTVGLAVCSIAMFGSGNVGMGLVTAVFLILAVALIAGSWRKRMQRRRHA